MDNCVKEDDHVIFQFEHGDDSFAFCIAKKGQKVKIKGRQYVIDSIIGAPYGSCFEVEKRKLKRSKTDGNSDDDIDGSMVIPERNNDSITKKCGSKIEKNNNNIQGNTRDNRNLIDDNSAQKLQQKEIGDLRDAGTSGSDIIKKLVQNSATFHTKTEFSQAKYLKRKRQKYTPRVRLIRPCAQSLLACMYAKNPQRVLSLRPDGLSMLLANANVCPCKSIMVVESTSGIVLGAVAERIGGYGVALNMYLQSHPSLVMIERFNFDSIIKQSIFHFPFSRINRLKMMKEQIPLKDEYNGSKITIGDNEAYEIVSKGMDGLVVCTDIDIKTILNVLLPFLGSSKPFAIFSPFLQGLIECYMELKNRNVALHLQITENWVREFQVLKGRTRPNMNMDDSGGYVLSGIKL